MSCRLNGRRVQTRINLSTSGDNTVIAAPTTGFIEIDYFDVLASGGANTLQYKDGASTVMYQTALTAAAGHSFNPAKDQVVLEITNGNAFIINLSAATTVEGVVIYRILNENI